MKTKLTAVLLALALLAGCAPSGPEGSPPASPDTSASASAAPSESPSGEPSAEPTDAPSAEASGEPSAEPSDEPSETPSDPPVYTDWSQLDPAEFPEDEYTYSPHYSGGRLMPGDDYGLLLPYIGVAMDKTYWGEGDSYCFGVMDRSGHLVTDPVYNGVLVCGGYLILIKLEAAPNGVRDEYTSRRYVTVASQDGRWVREMGLQKSVVNAWDDTGLAACIGPDGEISFINSDGEITSLVTKEVYAPLIGADGLDFGDVYLSLKIYDGLGYLKVTEFTDAYIYLDPATGAASLAPPEGHAAEPVYVSREPVDENGDPIVPDLPGMSDVWAVYDDVTGELYYNGYTGDGDTCSLFDRDGNLIRGGYEPADSAYEPVLGGTIALFERRSGLICYARCDLETGECIFRYVLRSNSD